MSATKPELAVDIGGVLLRNPVLTASGTFGYGEEISSFIDLSRLGGVVVKSISFEPKAGNPPQRIFETPAGMLNAIGLQNVGVERFVREKLPFLLGQKTAVIVNIYGHSIEEYVAVAERLNGVGGISGLEMNLSCPHVKEGGIVFGTDLKLLARVVSSVREATDLPIMVKLTPNVTSIAEAARAAEASGANAVSVINTLLGMVIDVDSRRPRLSTIYGGLSGPAIRPIALKMVWDAVRAVRIPVVGIGGIATARDALEFLIAGARAVQIGTANFYNPRAAIEVLEGIEAYLVEQGIDDIQKLIGSLEES